MNLDLVVYPWPFANLKQRFSSLTENRLEMLDSVARNELINGSKSIIWLAFHITILIEVGLIFGYNRI